MEVSAILALVLSRLRCDRRSPKSALDVGCAGWVEAVWAGCNCRVPLEEDVVPCAKIDGVAALLALHGIVTVQGVEAQIGVLLYGAIKVHEGLFVTRRGGSLLRGVLETVSDGSPKDDC